MLARNDEKLVSKAGFNSGNKAVKLRQADYTSPASLDRNDNYCYNSCEITFAYTASLNLLIRIRRL